MRKPKKRKPTANAPSRDTLKEFFAALGKTETEPIDDAEVERALYRKAVEGNIAAQQFWLKNRQPDKWKDKPVCGDGEAEVQTARDILISVRRTATDEYEAGAVPEAD